MTTQTIADLTLERRFTPSATPIRIERREGERPVIVGYAAVFFRDEDPGTEYQLWSDLVERIAPGAFDRAIRERDDCRALFNHMPSNLLGRLSAGDLRLKTDAVGLWYEIDPPDTQVGRDVLALIERGDLTGSSFAFRAERVVWIEEEDRDIRVVESVKLYDVGPVTYPAYESTSTGLRSEGSTEALAQREQWRAARARARRSTTARLREIESRL